MVTFRAIKITNKSNEVFLWFFVLNNQENCFIKELKDTDIMVGG